jgi:hypothetical protein
MLGSLQEAQRVRYAVKQIGAAPNATQYRVELYINGRTEYAPAKASEPAALLAAQAYLDGHYAGRTL